MLSPAHSPFTPSRARHLAAAWYFSELWGWSPREVPTPTSQEPLMKAVLVCANADGGLTEAERAWVVGRAALAGATDASLEELGKYSASEDLDSLLAALGQQASLRLPLIYTAIKAATVDGDYRDAQRRMITHVAAALSVREAEVAAIEHVVEQEARLRETRIRLCFPEGNPLELSSSNPPLSGLAYAPIDAARRLATQWYYREQWGWHLEHVFHGSGRGAFLKALMVCANGDGQLAEAERGWVLGCAATAGAPEGLLDELQAYAANDSVEHVVAQSASIDRSRRAVIYLAILAARSDQNYSGGERRAIHFAATTLGLRDDETVELERLVAAEARMRTERVAACLSPNAAVS